MWHCECAIATVAAGDGYEQQLLNKIVQHLITFAIDVNLRWWQTKANLSNKLKMLDWLLYTQAIPTLRFLHQFRRFLLKSNPYIERNDFVCVCVLFWMGKFIAGSSVIRSLLSMPDIFRLE